MAVRGGSITGRLTDQYLPASMPGFHDARVYPLTHADVRRAEALARGHTRSGTAALWVKDTPTDIAQAHIIQRDLRPLGLRVTVTTLPGPALFQRLFTPGSAYDMTLLGYGPDYFDPYAMLDVLFDGRLLGSPYNFNLGHFDSPAFDARFAAASKLPAGPRVPAPTAARRGAGARAGAGDRLRGREQSQPRVEAGRLPRLQSVPRPRGRLPQVTPYGASTVTQTRPCATATPAGRPPTLIVLDPAAPWIDPRRLVPSALFATQTRPAP